MRGVRDGSGERYRALPYAAAPTGAGRFAPPSPHPGWSGVRDATRPSPTAPQPHRDFGRLDMTPYFGPGWVPGEEYLTVDVHTPAASTGTAFGTGTATGVGGRPVMVFVHGGGFVTGSNRAALYDGSAFARDGVVLVTVNYRLGIPGFLDVAGAPPNRGLLDVLAALRWIRDTIAVFGGDPENVTVFGQSAGATLVGALLATPQAKGLFRRAIIQSGNGTGAFTPEQARKVTAAAAAALGIEPTAEAFAPIPDERFLAVLPALAGLDLRTDTATDPLAGLSPFSLVLPVQPADALADGPAGAIDLLIGTNIRRGAPLSRTARKPGLHHTGRRARSRQPHACGPGGRHRRTPRGTAGRDTGRAALGPARSGPVRGGHDAHGAGPRADLGRPHVPLLVRIPLHGPGRASRRRPHR